MPIKKLVFGISTFIVLCGSVAFGAGRITGPVDPGKRCMGQPMPADTCEKIRQKALSIGCIDEQEYQALKGYGAYPSCSLLKGEGPLMLDGWCACGCFHPQTMISAVFNGTGRRVDVAATIIAHNRRDFGLLALESDATLSSFAQTVNSIGFSTKGEETRPLFVIRTVDGRSLAVTGKHPILTNEGKMVQAQSLKTTDTLVGIDGRPVGIRKISRAKFKGDVVNFSTNAATKNGHVIFAEGLAVGDQYWQAGLEDELNQIFIRR